MAIRISIDHYAFMNIDLDLWGSFKKWKEKFQILFACLFIYLNSLLLLRFCTFSPPFFWFNFVVLFSFCFVFCIVLWKLCVICWLFCSWQELIDWLIDLTVLKPHFSLSLLGPHLEPTMYSQPVRRWIHQQRRHVGNRS